MGRGLAGFAPAGEVSRNQLELMLLGCHPGNGRRLLGARGSAERAHRLRGADDSIAPPVGAEELLTIPQAARLVGVSARYLRGVAVATAAARETAPPTIPGAESPPLDGAYLDAVRDEPRGHWRVTRSEVSRFAAERNPPAAVIGYDVTFSMTKSVSLLWAWADPERQATIVAAVHDSVAAGVAYLQDHAAFARSGPVGSPHPATGLVVERVDNVEDGLANVPVSVVDGLEVLHVEATSAA